MNNDKESTPSTTLFAWQTWHLVVNTFPLPPQCSHLLIHYFVLLFDNTNYLINYAIFLLLLLELLNKSRSNLLSLNDVSTAMAVVTSLYVIRIIGSGSSAVGTNHLFGKEDL